MTDLHVDREARMSKQMFSDQSNGRPWLLIVKGRVGKGTYLEGRNYAVFSMRAAAEQMRDKALRRGFNALVIRATSAEAMVDYLDGFFDGGESRRSSTKCSGQ